MRLFTVIIFGAVVLTLLNGCGAKQDTAQSNLNKLNNALNVDYTNIEYKEIFSVEDNATKIVIRPSQPIQNTSKAHKFIIEKWHEAARSKCGEHYDGEPDIKVGYAKKGNLNGKNINAAFKILIIEANGRATCT